MARLEDICIINPKAPVLADDLEVSFVPMPKVGEQGEFDPSEIKEYREVKKGFTNFQNGDVLFAKITPCMENGKGAVAKDLKNGYGFGSTEFHVLRPDYSKVTSEWLYYLTSWNAFRKDAESNMTGSAGQKRVPKTFLEKYEVNLPEVEKQNEMADTLEYIGKLIALRKEQLAKLDELVKSRFIELFGDPQSNPYGYQYAKLSDIATYFNGLTYKPENVSEEGTIVLRSSNIQNSQLDFADTVRVDCAIKERLMVQENDILMCSRNGSAKLVGKVALIKGIQEPMSFGAFMMIIRSQYFGYLMTYFQMDAFRQQIKTGATTTINQITGRMLDDVTIPLPPMALVDQFAAFVEQTDKSKLAIQESLAELETLKKALMQKYFG